MSQTSVPNPITASPSARTISTVLQVTGARARSMLAGALRVLTGSPQVHGSIVEQRHASPDGRTRPTRRGNSPDERSAAVAAAILAHGQERMAWCSAYARTSLGCHPEEHDERSSVSGDNVGSEH